MDQCSPDASGAPSGRPYRSHKQPACQTCRKRKIRCFIDVPNSPCRFCRERGAQCQYADEQTPPSPAKRARTSVDQTPRGHAIPPPSNPRAAGHSLANIPSVSGTSPTESSLLVNPTMAEDLQILEHYLAPKSASSQSSAKQYSMISNSAGKPIVYLTVPKGRSGLVLPAIPGKTQREILDQVLRPHNDEAIKLFFEVLHPCWPIVDKRSFLEVWQRDPSDISPALVCDIYASVLIFWSQSAALRGLPQPDTAFAWNQAVVALQDDFMAPTVSTISAALLDMVGRPVIGIQGNIMTCGRTVTLAHSLGLHRDPTAWRATAHEKSVRIRLWWGVVIHDSWASLAHGTPPTIQEGAHDVPLPAPDTDLAISRSGQAANNTFFYLCSLTQILTAMLPLVYSLHPKPGHTLRITKRLECVLEDWEAALPVEIRIDSVTWAAPVNGTSSLWFCYLSLKLLLCRLSLRSTLMDAPAPEAKQYWQALLRDAAIKVAKYVVSLTPSQLAEFWLPYTAHLLVSAATMLLRCTIEAQEPRTKRSCATMLHQLLTYLEWAQQSCHWDLGDFVIDRCGEPIRKIAAAFAEPQCTAPPSLYGADGNGQPAPPDLAAAGTSLNSGELFGPMDDPLDFPWETMWNSFTGPGSIEL